MKKEYTRIECAGLTVKLKSGGPLMTINFQTESVRVHEIPNIITNKVTRVECAWFVEGILHKGEFHVSALTEE